MIMDREQQLAVIHAALRLPDAFLLICGSAFHDEAHGAFMALPPYTRTREGEAPPGSWPATLLAGLLS